LSVTTVVAVEQEERVKSREEVMNMSEAFDLCGSFRDAGELAGVSHHTVARYVAERDAGALAGGPGAGSGSSVRGCRRSGSGSSGRMAGSAPTGFSTS